MRRKLTLSFLALVPAASFGAGPAHTGPFGPDGTWNVYQLIEESLTWEEARQRAETLPPPCGDPSAKGHLVTFGSIAENHFVRTINRQAAWCGLTDDPRFGGVKSGSNPTRGWKWVDGSPMTFTNWLPDQPDEWKNEGTGEDAVYFEWSGRWADGGSGTAGQAGFRFYFAVEWETRSKTPVEGAIPYEKAWPEKSVMPPQVPGKWNARWVSGYVKHPSNWIERPRTLMDAFTLLRTPAEAGTGTLKPRVQSEGSTPGTLPWLWITTPDAPHLGWISDTAADRNFPGLSTADPHVGAVIGKIRVKKAGPYTFSISANDAFALRIGGQKWVSVSGTGYIDPLDPLTVIQPWGTLTSKTLAVMDLPAGDHVVEALWMSENGRVDFQVLSAAGIQKTEGSQAGWRPLGHTGGSEKIPRLGVTDAGWKVECSRPGTKHIGLQEGLVKLSLDSGLISKKELVAINYAQGAEANPSRFPGTVAFPHEGDGTDFDFWPLRATARLVVPQDGSYRIGLRACGLAALRVKGGLLKEILPGPQTSAEVHRQQDFFDFSGKVDLKSDPEIQTQWDLKKGEYEIDVFYAKNIGPALLTVFSSPEGPYPPLPISKGGAGLSEDVPGLPLAAP